MKRKLLVGLLIFLTGNLFGQISWGDEIEVATPSYGDDNPKVVLDASQNPVISWGDAGNMYVSYWSGSSFSSPIQVNPDSLNVLSGSGYGPEIASHGDTLYALFKESPPTSGNIFILRSVDGGVNWGDPVQVDDIGENLSEFTHLTTDAIGNPVVIFNKFDDGWTNARWVCTYSTDFGVTFSPDTIASGWSGTGDGPACECCPATVAVSGSTVAVAYRDNDSNIRDSWVGISYDGGNEFTAGMDVDQLGWNISFCPSSGPDIEIVGDELYTTYMSSATGDSRVYYSKSTLSDANGGAAIQLSEETEGLGLQNLPRLSIWENSGIIIWKQILDGDQMIAASFTNNIDGGFPTTYDNVVPQYAANPDVVMSEEKIHLVWRDYNTGSVKYKLGTYGDPLGIGGQSVQSPKLSPNPARDFWQIEFSNLSAPLDLKLFDINGSLVWESKMDQSDNNKTLIPAKELSKGVYNLHLSGIDYNTSVRLIKK